MFPRLATRRVWRPPSCSRLFSSSSASPSHPVVAVSSVVLAPGPAVLLVRRAKAPHKGVWSLPGGRVHLGETVAAAASREVFEETGVQLHGHLQSFSCTDAIFPDPQHPESVLFHYAIVQMAAQLPEQPPTRPGDDASACRWASLDELDSFVEVTGAEAPVDPFAQDCVSEHVRPTVRKAVRFLSQERGWAAADANSQQ